MLIEEAKEDEEDGWFLFAIFKVVVRFIVYIIIYFLTSPSQCQGEEDTEPRTSSTRTELEKEDNRLTSIRCRAGAHERLFFNLPTRHLTPLYYQLSGHKESQWIWAWKFLCVN